MDRFFQLAGDIQRARAAFFFEYWWVYVLIAAGSVLWLVLSRQR